MYFFYNFSYNCSYYTIILRFTTAVQGIFRYFFSKDCSFGKIRGIMAYIHVHMNKKEIEAIFSMRKHLFGDTIKPACAYCIFGDDSPDGGAIVCVQKGRVMPRFRCRRFRYDPLRRVPAQSPRLPDYSQDEFDFE